MPYTFTDGLVATKAQLDTLLPAQVAQAGTVSITPVANTPTSLRVNFVTPFLAAPVVFTTPVTILPGGVVKGTSVTDVTTTGFTLWIYRTTNTATTVNWHAWGSMSALFTNGKPGYASLLNAGVGLQAIAAGSLSITPVANNPTSSTVTFATPFASTPTVVLIPSSTVVGTSVDGWSVSEVGTANFKAWIRRSNNTTTSMLWAALGRV